MTYGPSYLHKRKPGRAKLPPGKKKRTVQITFPPALIREIDTTSLRNGRNRSQEVVHRCTEYLTGGR